MSKDQIPVQKLLLSIQKHDNLQGKTLKRIQDLLWALSCQHLSITECTSSTKALIVYLGILAKQRKTHIIFQYENTDNIWSCVSYILKLFKLLSSSLYISLYNEINQSIYSLLLLLQRNELQFFYYFVHDLLSLIDNLSHISHKDKR